MAEEAKTDFDAELESIMGGPETPEGGPQAAPVETPPAEKAIEAGGRKFKDIAALTKAHDALMREYGRKQQDYTRAKSWLDFDGYLGEHPELRQTLKERIDEYVTRKDQGQPTRTAAKEAGISPDMVRRIDDLESRWEDIQMRDEVTMLRSKYKLDAEALDEVLRESHRRGGENLETVYKIIMFDRVQGEARSKAEQDVRADLQRKKSADVGPSTAADVAPAAKSPAAMGEKEYGNALDKELERFGVR